MKPIEPGTPAPDFSLTHRAGEPPVRLSDHRGEKVVVLFFPLAFSSVCTAEMCHVAGSYAKYRELDARVLGISVDSPFTNRKFAESCGADFPILSDFNRRAASAFGVRDDDYFGLEGVARRSAFVVDEEGVVRWTWIGKADGSDQPDFDEILRVLRELDRKSAA